MRSPGKDLRAIPVLRALIPFITGIMLAPLIPGQLTCTHAAGCLLLLLLLAGLLVHRSGSRKPVHGYLFFAVMFLAFVCLGFWRTRNEPRCYSPLPAGRNVVLTGRIPEEPEKRTRGYRVGLRLDGVVTSDHYSGAAGNLLVYLPGDTTVEGGGDEGCLTPSKDTTADGGVAGVAGRQTLYSPAAPPRTGERWMVAGVPRLIGNSGNPGEFDYAGYMRRRHTGYLLFVEDPHHFRRLSGPSSNLAFAAGKIAVRIQSHWPADIPEYAVLRAITLGNKRALPDRTRDHFAGAGAMHILAVSGLHVGIIWYALTLLIRFPVHLRFFRILKPVLVIGVLWFYAAITGFSASVTRSVFMFSLLTLARVTGRDSQVLNTLFLSAMVLLWLDPDRIHEPGFQLSYAAVTGIVTLHPFLTRRLRPRSRLLRWAVDLVGVSVAAQLATFPLTLLYFHQFPVYFILTNLLVIPLVTLLLAGFVLFAPALIRQMPPEFFSGLLRIPAALLTRIVEAIARLPGAVLDPVALSPSGAVLWGLLLLLVILSLSYRRISYYTAMVAVGSLLLLNSARLEIDLQRECMVQLYHFRGSTLLSERSGGVLRFYHFNWSGKEQPYLERYIREHDLSRGRRDPPLVHVMTKADTVGTRVGRAERLSESCWSVETGVGEVLVLSYGYDRAARELTAMGEWDMIVVADHHPLEWTLEGKEAPGVLFLSDGSGYEGYEKAWSDLTEALHRTSASGPYRVYSERYEQAIK